MNIGSGLHMIARLLSIFLLAASACAQTTPSESAGNRGVGKPVFENRLVHVSRLEIAARGQVILSSQERATFLVLLGNAEVDWAEPGQKPYRRPSTWDHTLFMSSPGDYTLTNLSDSALSALLVSVLDASLLKEKVKSCQCEPVPAGTAETTPGLRTIERCTCRGGGFLVIDGIGYWEHVGGEGKLRISELNLHARHKYMQPTRKEVPTLSLPREHNAGHASLLIPIAPLIVEKADGGHQHELLKSGDVKWLDGDSQYLVMVPGDEDARFVNISFPEAPEGSK